VKKEVRMRLRMCTSCPPGMRAQGGLLEDSLNLALQTSHDLPQQSKNSI